MPQEILRHKHRGRQGVYPPFIPIKKVKEMESSLVFADGSEIPFSDIVDFVSELFRENTVI